MSIFSSHSRSFFRSEFKKGFTLVELLVAMGIMVIITSAILLRQSNFNSTTLLRSLSYSVALSLRQAQVYGTSVYGTTTLASGAPVYARGYGLSFSSGDSTHYVLFADFNGGPYDYSTSLQNQVKLFTIGKGFYISTACGIQGSSLVCTKTCPVRLPAGVSSCTPNTLQYVSVVFKRPNPDALVYPAPYTSAYVQITSTEGSTRGVQVSSTGEIGVGTAGS